VPLAGASVTVYETGTANLATIYSDNGITPLANPFTGEDDGSFSFYAADGRYDVLVHKSPYRPVKITDILLEDPSTSISTSFSSHLSTYTHTDISANKSAIASLGIVESTDVSALLSADVSVVSRLSIVDSSDLSVAASADTSIVSRLIAVDSSLSNTDSNNLSVVVSADISVVTRLSIVDSSDMSSAISAADSAALVGGGGTDSEARSMATSVATQESADASTLLSADTSVIARLSAVDSANMSAAISLQHDAVTVSAPISLSGQALSLVNDAAAAITEIDTGALANSDTVIPTSKAVTTAIAGVSGGTLEGLEGYKNLVMAYASATTVTVTADKVQLANSDNEVIVLDSLSETLDITDAGVNGLDTGAEANSTWYHAWAIAKADGTLDGLFSASATAPTLPAGYSYKCYLGAVYNNSSGNFVGFYQYNNIVSIPSIIIVSGGTASSYTEVDISAVVPSTSNKIYGTATLADLGTADIMYLFVAPNNDGLGSAIVGGSFVEGWQYALFFNLIQTGNKVHTHARLFYYNSHDGAGTPYAYISIAGWEY
jgi:hypothetical protein